MNGDGLGVRHGRGIGGTPTGKESVLVTGTGTGTGIVREIETETEKEIETGLVAMIGVLMTVEGDQTLHAPGAMKEVVLDMVWVGVIGVAHGPGPTDVMTEESEVDLVVELIEIVVTNGEWMIGANGVGPGCALIGVMTERSVAVAVNLHGPKGESGADLV